MDQRLFLLLNSRWTSPFLDRLMAAASALDAWLPLLLLLVALTAWFGRRRARLFLLALGLVLALGDTVVGNDLKHLVHRPRPFQSLDGVRQVELARRAHPRFVALFLPPLVTQLTSPEPLPTRRPRGVPFPRTTRSTTSPPPFCSRCSTDAGVGSTSFPPRCRSATRGSYVGSHWPSDVLFSAFLGAGLALVTMAAFQLVVARWPTPSTHSAPPP